MFFPKLLDELRQKPNKIWVYKSSKFHNRSMKSFLQNNDIMIETFNEGKSAIAKRFIRTFKNTAIQIIAQ